MNKIASYLATEKLKPHPKNKLYYGDENDETYAALKQSIERHGIRDPLKILPDHTIIGGHRRFKIATELGMPQLPVVIVDVDAREAEYLLLADNEERRKGDGDDPIKRAQRALFLKEYWKVPAGRLIKASTQKTMQDVADAVGEGSVRGLQRLINLTDLIPELQELVASGKMGTSAGEIISHLYPEEQRKYVLEKWGTELAGLQTSEASTLRKEVEASREREETLETQLEDAQEEIEGQKDKINGYVNQITKLQDNYNKLEGEAQKGHEAMQKLLNEKEAMESKLAEIEKPGLDTPDDAEYQTMVAQKKVLEKEIDSLQEKKNTMEFDLRDIEMEMGRIKNQQSREDVAILVLRKKFESLTSIKGDLEYALKEVEVDPYGTLQDRLNRYIGIWEDIGTVLKTNAERLRENGWQKNSGVGADNVLKMPKKETAEVS